MSRVIEVKVLPRPNESERRQRNEQTRPDYVTVDRRITAADLKDEFLVVDGGAEL